MAKVKAPETAEVPTYTRREVFTRISTAFASLMTKRAELQKIELEEPEEVKFNGLITSAEQWVEYEELVDQQEKDYAAWKLKVAGPREEEDALEKELAAMWGLVDGYAFKLVHNNELYVLDFKHSNGHRPASVIITPWLEYCKEKELDPETGMYNED